MRGAQHLFRDRAPKYSTPIQNWPGDHFFALHSFASDDAEAGWIYTQHTYDWKSRPRVTTNPSTTSNPNETTQKEASYAGCGCAGGEVVTITDEVGRRQNIYSDVLGRPWKTETLNWDGIVYSTTTSEPPFGLVVPTPALPLLGKVFVCADAAAAIAVVKEHAVASFLAAATGQVIDGLSQLLVRATQPPNRTRAGEAQRH